MRAIVELARGLGIETVAEYVENDEIAQEVRRLGVDYGQGYVYGKPAPLSEVLESLAQDESKRLHPRIVNIFHRQMLKQEKIRSAFQP